MEGKRAAIDLDSIADTPLSEISAADFLDALAQGGDDIHALGGTWPEKKKVELVVSENIGTVSVGRVLNILRIEKKKAEREIPDRVGPIIRPPDEWLRAIDERIDARLGRG